jgi:hypothetical protein
MGSPASLKIEIVGSNRRPLLGIAMRIICSVLYK